MPRYRRAFVPGGTYFFTVNLFDRRSNLLVQYIDALRDAVRLTKRSRPFEIDAMVILPNHLHAVWTLPDGDADFSVRWQEIKANFSKAVPVRPSLGTSERERGDRGIWQRRFWEHVIEDDTDLEQHIDYCWYNPVLHGLVDNVEDWRFSSFHRDNQDAAILDREEMAAALARRAEKFSLSRFGEVT